MPPSMFAIAVWLFVAQPSREHADLGALVAVAAIVGTVLSLSLTATLLIAQSTAERYPQVLYAEFRKDWAWLVLPAALGIGVVLIIAAALLQQTFSTAWASLAVASALGLFAASLLPRLLNSLDRTELARRLAGRFVRELRKIGRRPALGREGQLMPVTKRGMEIGRQFAILGANTNDPEVVRAGYASTRRVMVAYLNASPTRGWNGEVINLAFEQLRGVTDRCLAEDPVLLLPPAIEELTALGVESQASLKENENEAISGWLNRLLVHIVEETLTNEQSAAAAMATGGIGESGRALIRAGSPNGVADHIRELRQIATAALGTWQDHVAGVAHVELTRLATGLATMVSHDIMSRSLYFEVCIALNGSVDAFLSRPQRSALMFDTAWMPTTAPHMPYNLAQAIVAGVAADSSDRHRSRRTEFGEGALVLVEALVKLSRASGVGLTNIYALDAVHLGVLGALSLKGDVDRDLVRELWVSLVRRLIDPDSEVAGEVELLPKLLLVGVYEANEAGATASAMRIALREALGLTTGIADDWHRRRRARSWLQAGRAALASGDEEFANEIAAGIATDLAELRAAVEGYEPIELEDGWSPAALLVGIHPFARVEIPDAHKRPDVIEAFAALLRKYEGTGGSETPRSESR